MSWAFFSDTDNLGYALYAVAYGTSLIAFVMTRINWLRALFVLSSACYALYYYIFPAEPLWLDIISEGAFVLVNLFMLGFVLWSSTRVRLNHQEQHLYDNHFGSTAIQDFAKIVRLARWEVLEGERVLIEDNQPVSRLYYLFSGEAKIELRNGTSVIRPSGSVFGELSYRTSNAAAGTVTINDTSVIASWDQKSLQKLCRSNSRVAAGIDSLLSSQMAIKLS